MEFKLGFSASGRMSAGSPGSVFYLSAKAVFGEYLLHKERSSHHYFIFPQITQINADSTKPVA